VVAIGEVGGDEEVEGLGIYDPVAAIARAFDAGSFAFASYLLGEVQAVATSTEPVAALHSEALETRSIFAANVTREVIDDLYSWWALADLLSKASLIKHLLLTVHVLFDQTFLVPSSKT
jgi:hypothetical protein